ncbi:uncharacterized protein FOMMEDRAFT_159702 [Fomitiporia mediterranea MF3/22]|uniref:uncharacterized protein n=1 Tax=Fomitiporia mediterranea (strain MF3/22) TaxID=694068 RepID=UPI000440733E|nr:uncharacterized protein FOMMEDRAFT_159702 [Fomitiporia mediterranea MF3/22]EJD00089.1 hypothetical protein FOMMEDRAFT_159702 [Fomitiporia mediterranea MF3/22]
MLAPVIHVDGKLSLNATSGMEIRKPEKKRALRAAGKSSTFQRPSGGLNVIGACGAAGRQLMLSSATVPP